MQRNLKGIHAVIDSAQARIQNTPHQKSQAVWLINELNREASAALTKLGIMENSSYERVISIAAIENIMTREQVLNWLTVLRNTLEDMVGNGQMPAYQDNTTLASLAALDGMPESVEEALKTVSIVPDRPIDINSSEVDQMLGEEHSLIMTGEASIDDVLAEMAERSKDIQGE